jgi:hypothetical protein
MRAEYYAVRASNIIQECEPDWITSTVHDGVRRLVFLTGL